MTSSLAARTPRWRAAAAVLVISAAAVTGALTPVGMHDLPRSIESFANSSAPWTLITFASVYASRIRGWHAAVLGALSFLVMDAFFYIVYDSLGSYYPHHYLAFWTGIAIIIGPLVGLCASWLRAESVTLRTIAVAAPSAVLVGEGLHMLSQLPGRSTPYAVALLVVGAALFVWLARRNLRTLRIIGLSGLSCAVGAGAFFVVYGMLPLVLDKVVP